MTIDIEKIKSVDLGNYDLTIGIMQALYGEAEKSGRDYDFALLIYSYKYGFMRGQNAEKSRQRKRRKSEVEV